MTRIYFLLRSRLFLLFSFRLILLSNFSLDLGMRTGHLLLLSMLADFSRVQHASFKRIFDNIRILLASNHVLEGHHGVVVEHKQDYNFKL